LVTGYIGRIAGKFDTVLDPFIRVNAQIINSVAEQQISSWGNIYVELGIGILFFLIGFYFIMKNPTNRNVFLIVFAVTSLYFAASMIRLLAILAPAFAIIASIGILGLIKPFYILLHETPSAKMKHRLKVSKEYSIVAVLLIFAILVSLFAFTPQTGGVPRVISQSFVPTAISASSLPIGGTTLNQPVSAWLDALNWLKTNVPSNNVVVSWWDYGFWLTDLGNVTTMTDNTTGNTTQIENVAFAYMGNENQTMQILSTYENYNSPGRVNYILVFETLQISQSSSGSGYVVSPAGYGDEGKWVWMARISGQAENRLLQEGYMNQGTAWTDETTFGSINKQTNQWQWSNQGLNCTVEELLNYAQVQYCNNINSLNLGVTLTPDHTATTPTYFQEAYFAGINTSPTQYGGLIPIVAVYSINWPAYYAATGTTGTGATT
jgi:asparagine N-glycosylation enzyme membrane subunit Stt3